MQRHLWGKTEITLVCSLYEQGLSGREVSEETGVPQRTIYKYLEDNGIQRRKVTSNGYKPTEQHRAIMSKTHKGKRLSESTKKKISDAKRSTYNGLNGYGHLKSHNSGYVLAYCPCHPHASKDGYVMLHTVIVERELGRYLLPTEVVHHINHIRDDNRPENLILMDKKEHMSMHMKERYRKGE